MTQQRFSCQHIDYNANGWTHGIKRNTNGGGKMQFSTPFATDVSSVRPRATAQSRESTSVRPRATAQSRESTSVRPQATAKSREVMSVEAATTSPVPDLRLTGRTLPQSPAVEKRGSRRKWSPAPWKRWSATTTRRKRLRRCRKPSAVRKSRRAAATCPRRRSP